MRKLRAVSYLAAILMSPFVAGETHALPPDEVTVQLGAALPSSDGLKTNAETGVYFGGSYQYYVTQRLSVGLQGGWNKFGKGDRVEEGFGEPTVTVFEFGTQVEAFLHEQETARRRRAYLNPSLVAGFGVANLGFVQDFSTYDTPQQQIPDFKGASTGWWGYAGAQNTIPISERGAIKTRLRYNVVNQDEEDEAWWALWAAFVYSIFLPPDAAYAATTERFLGFFDGVGFSSACGYPCGDFDDEALPGLAFGVVGERNIYKNLSAMVGLHRQMYGTPGYDDDAVNDRSVGAWQLELTGIQDLPFLRSNAGNAAVRVTLLPTFLNNELKSGNVVVNRDDSGALILAGLSVERRVSERAKLVLLGDIPVLGAMFEHNEPRQARVGLQVLITPRVTLDDSKS